MAGKQGSNATPGKQGFQTANPTHPPVPTAGNGAFLNEAAQRSAEIARLRDERRTDPSQDATYRDAYTQYLRYLTTTFTDGIDKEERGRIINTEIRQHGVAMNQAAVVEAVQRSGGNYPGPPIIFSTDYLPDGADTPCPAITYTDAAYLNEYHEELKSISPVLYRILNATAQHVEKPPRGGVEYYPGVNLGDAQWIHDEEEAERYYDPMWDVIPPGPPAIG